MNENKVTITLSDDEYNTLIDNVGLAVAVRDVLNPTVKETKIAQDLYFKLTSIELPWLKDGDE